MRIVVLAGGIGGARFLRGLKQAAPDADITVIGNTGDDIHLFGLKVCPDLDTVMYTLGGGINEEQGWGRTDETFRVKEELAAYGVGPEWFGLGDRSAPAGSRACGCSPCPTTGSRRMSPSRWTARARRSTSRSTG
nr:2-phospho-L-lactate transferase CofD family protein [Streptomyces sp. MBT60]